MKYPCLLLITCLFFIIDDGSSQSAPENSFLKREYSLTKPYSGNGMTMPYWDFRGNTLISNNFIRLTQDLQGQEGGIWSKVQCYVRNWEAHLHFRIHGQGRTLAADGLALWYTQEKMTPGPVFGSRDEFHGLGIFLDTYKNGGSAITFPQISAMVGNGSMKYDHLNDGKANSIGSCAASIRNKKHDTYMLIRYEDSRLQVMLDVDDAGKWKECFDVSGVRLPTGYFFGVTSATGDLADNHEVVSFKFYELNTPTTDDNERDEWRRIKPGVDYLKPPLDNVDGGEGSYRNSSISGFKLFMLVVFILIGVAVCAIAGYVVFKKREEQKRKRFY